ncbi:MAG: RHS repeat-associated core domain-containing protein [Thermoplasmata archaeon]
MSQDPMGNQAGANRYAYCGNNPTNNRDPSGMLINQPPPNLIDGGGGGYSGSGSGTQQVGQQINQPPVATGTHGTGTGQDTYEGVENYGEGVKNSASGFANSVVEFFKSRQKALLDYIPEYKIIGSYIQFTWTKTKAKMWCNNFQDAANTCGNAGSPEAIAGCYVAVSAGAVPFCLCGYLANGLTMIVDWLNYRITYISCNGFSYTFQDLIEDTNESIDRATQPTPIEP